MTRFRTYDEWEESLGEETYSHSVTYYIDKQMTMDEWIALDEAMDEALVRVFGDDHTVVGIAGPIPFERDES